MMPVVEPGQTRPGVSGTMVSGAVFWPLDPRPEEINILDIAHNLAMQCRFNGGVRAPFLSVAEHSWHVSYQVPEEFAFEGLMHDAAEAYLGDLIRPLKVLPEFEHYKVLEHRWEKVIAAKFGLQFPLPPEIKIADNAVVGAENEQWRPKSAATVLHDPNNVAKIRVEGWVPAVAKMHFIGRFVELDQQRRLRHARAA